MRHFLKKNVNLPQLLICGKKISDVDRLPKTHTLVALLLQMSMACS